MSDSMASVGKTQHEHEVSCLFPLTHSLSQMMRITSDKSKMTIKYLKNTP